MGLDKRASILSALFDRDEVEKTRSGVAEGRANIEKTEETLKYPNQGAKETDRYTTAFAANINPLSLFQNSIEKPSRFQIQRYNVMR